MKIKSIKWLSEEALEAEVVVTDGYLEISCFAHPFLLEIGDRVSDYLICIGVEKVQRCNAIEFEITRSSNTFSYYFIGKVAIVEESILNVGDIYLKLDIPLPGDLTTGEFVSFTCERVDLN